jgi:hypothetical protein
MPPFEDPVKSVDALAQEVVNAWGLNMRAGNAISLTPEFLDVFEKASRYQGAKRVADFYRLRNALLSEEGEEAAQAEETARRTFTEVYKPWVEKHTS